MAALAAVFDGHGGNATSEWLAANLLNYVEKFWEGDSAPERAITEAFIQADKVGAAPRGGTLCFSAGGQGGSALETILPGGRGEPAAGARGRARIPGRTRAAHRRTLGYAREGERMSAGHRAAAGRVAGCGAKF